MNDYKDECLPCKVFSRMTDPTDWGVPMKRTADRISEDSDGFEAVVAIGIIAVISVGFLWFDRSISLALNSLITL